MTARIAFAAALLCVQGIALAQVQPATRKETKVFSEHSYQRTDDYFWLSNRNDSNVIHHLEAENAYVDAYMKRTEGLQKKVYEELIERIPGRDQSLPTKRNGYWYYGRFEEGKQYPYLVRRKGSMTAKEELLLDQPALAAPYKVFLLRGTAVSPDNNLLAYGVDTAGDRRCLLYVRDLRTGQVSKEVIDNTSGNFAWADDNRTLYYVLNDPTVRAYRVMKHRLGTDPTRDEEVFAERDSTFRVGIRRSMNGPYLFISTNSTDVSEDRYIRTDDPSGTVHLVQARTPKLEYFTDYREGKVFHIQTNKDAKNFKLVTAPIEQPSANNWKDLIPASDKSYLEGAEVLKNYIVAQVRENGQTKIKVQNRKTGAWKYVDFGQEVYMSSMSLATDDYASDSIRYNFMSLATPSTDYSYHLGSDARKQLKHQKVGQHFDPSLYETKRLWSTSADGTKVPISLVYRKDKFRKDGSNPLLLYAYGSYGANSDPGFSPSVVSLLDRGVCYAITHIRGGQEMGRDWFEQGRLLNKKNTFQDFVDAAQFLVNEKYTSADRLFANGGSAGGMLMGAIVNMRPELFRGIIAEVPWMDVITDMFDTSLPLTTLEYDQWGDPNKKEYYDYMRSWSPYDNVKPAKYPSILATGGLNDTQVPYFSPAKWVARVRENNLGTNPVLFKVNMGAGHGGASGRFERQKLTALKYAFLLDQLGWNEQTKKFEKAF